MKVVKTDEELKPCPLCGHKPALYRTDWGYKFRVSCFTLHCNRNVETEDYDSEEDAIRAWNKGKIKCCRIRTPHTTKN